MKYSIFLILIVGILKSQTYMSKYEIKYFDNVSISDSIILDENEVPFILELEYTIFSSQDYMYLIAKNKKIISPFETEGNDIEIVKLDLNKKIAFNTTSNKYFNLIEYNESEFKNIIYDENYNNLVTPIVFIKGNKYGIKKIESKHITIELIETIKVDLELDFKKDFKKIKYNEIDEGLKLF